ncbi:MAG: hypothetical protein A2Z20_03340 [Bdellovibrionales bacterium RBG_16_40_8]|nr:MAG: hypothetical protein A2Z20_03340 [Bdellovibrionales bacterium RBG_16_40_8]
MDSSYPAEYVIALTGAIAQWNNIGQQLSKKDFFRLRTGSPGASSPRQDGYTKIYMLNTWEDDRRIEQARTTVYWSGSQIYESDIRINHKDYDFYLADDRPDYSKVHLESLIVHELGHVLGLAHTHNTESVMQVSLANGKVREEPQSPDIEALQCEY